MKKIQFQLDDNTYSRLRAVCSHHGEMSHIIRKGVRLIITTREKELAYVEESRRSTDTGKT